MMSMDNGRGVKGVYVLGGIAALVAALVFRRWLAAELDLIRSAGLMSVVQPAGVEDWFFLLQSRPLIGLVLLNGLDIVNYLLVGLIFTALFFALRSFNRPFMTLALLLVFCGIALFLSSNQAFALLSLSGRYAHAAAWSERASLLETGQVLLAVNNGVVFGTGMFWAFIFVNLAGLITAVVMVRSGSFGRASAWIGVLANAFGLGYFFTLAFYPPATFVPLSLSAPLLLIWYILIALRLFRLSRAHALTDPAAADS
jgi:hypothetical protein